MFKKSNILNLRSLYFYIKISHFSTELKKIYTYKIKILILYLIRATNFFQRTFKKETKKFNNKDLNFRQSKYLI